MVAFATSATSRARRRGLRGPGAVDETNTRSPPALEQAVGGLYKPMGPRRRRATDPFAGLDWPGTVGCLDSAIFGVKQIEGTNGILKN